MPQRLAQVNLVPCSLRLSNLILGLDGWQETDFCCQEVVAGFLLVRFSGAKNCHQGSCVCFFKVGSAPPNEVSNSSQLWATELDDLETCCLSTENFRSPMSKVQLGTKITSSIVPISIHRCLELQTSCFEDV